jgi:Mg2+ and Co2+ transporter CorA
MQLPTDWPLPQEITSRLGDRPGKQRAMFHAGHLLLILHKVPVDRTPDRTAVFFYRNPSGDWYSTSRGAGPGAVNQHLEAFEKAIDALEDQMKNADDAETYFKILQAIQPIHRATSHLLAALQSAREEAGDDKTIISYRDRALELDRAATLVHEEARNCMDFTLAMQAERQAQLTHKMEVATHRLNKIAALFLPVMAIAAVFGMNLPSGLEEVGVPGFWVLVILALLIGGIGTTLMTRR